MSWSIEMPLVTPRRVFQGVAPSLPAQQEGGCLFLAPFPRRLRHEHREGDRIPQDQDQPERDPPKMPGKRSLHPDAITLNSD